MTNEEKATKLKEQLIKETTDKSLEQLQETYGKELDGLKAEVKSLSDKATLEKQQKTAGKEAPKDDKKAIKTFVEGCQKGMFTGVGEEGGYFITERQLPIFFDYIENNSIVRPRSFNIPVDSSMPNAKVTMPKLKQDATGAFVEADFYPVGEGRAFTTTDAKIALATLEPKKHGCLVDMPNETLENTNAAEALINRMLKRAAVKYENTQFTSGAGGMFPIGFQNTEAMYTVKRNTANQVKYEDILAMLKVSMLDEKNNYIWMGSQSAFNYIYPMRDDSTYGEKVYRDGKLDGIPFIWTPTASALGTTNDLMLVNLQYYLTYIGTSLRLAQSKEYKFNRDMTVIRAKYSLDGDSWLSKYITRDDSTIVSPFIGLSSEVA